MGGSLLLDTNAVSALNTGDAVLRRRIAGADAAYMAIITVGELHFGARKSTHVDRNLARIEDLVRALPIVGCDEDTAAQYGIIKAALRTRGRPVPENDIWIAAIACQHALTLITRDAHFDEITGLVTEAW